MKRFLHITYAAMALAFSGQMAAQINYTEDFESEASWPENEFSITDEATCSGADNMYRVMLYGGFVSNLSAETTSSSIGTSNGAEVTLTYDYKLVPTGTPAEPVDNDDDWGNFSVSYATSESGPFTVLETIDTGNHVETANCITRTVNFTPANGTQIYLKIESHLGAPTNQISIYFDNIEATQGPSAPCETEAPDAEASQTLCGGSIVKDLAAEGDAIVWYSDAEGGEPLDVGTELVDGASYFAAVIPEGGCESVERTEVVVTLTIIDTPDVEEINQTFCDEAYVIDLQAEPNMEGGTIVWYDAEEEGNVLGDDVKVTHNGLYYAVQVVGDCESTERIEVRALITSVIEPAAESPQILEVEAGAETINLYEDVVVDFDEDFITWYPTLEDAQNGENAIGEEEMVAAGTYYVTQTDGECESEPTTVVIETVLGTADFDAASFRYYPNPVTNYLTLEYDGEMTAVTVFDLQGKKVIETNDENEMKHLDMSALAMGSYIVKVVAGGHTENVRIVKL